MKREEITKAMRWSMAEELRLKNLPAVNERAEEAAYRETFYTRYGKRLIDIVVSLTMLLLFLPVNLVILVITFFDVGSPVFFAQERVGKDGRTFRVYKFRNMTDARDEKGELLPPGQRITKFGYFMRKTSLDELLNFWSILKGDMSLIGPRPLVCEYYERYSDRHKKRLCVRPGLECPPRDRGSSVRSWQEQFENDVWYVEHISLKTDLMMAGNLIHFMVNPGQVKNRASVSRVAFMGYNEEGTAVDFHDIPVECFEKYD